jgi:3-hydroxyisobutyrate dehydrogenase-like beta-hydroxyacid dehydrogenase
VVGAQAAEMCFCVGADDQKDIEAARPVLELLGNHITHTGPVGTGSVAKLVRLPPSLREALSLKAGGGCNL